MFHCVTWQLSKQIAGQKNPHIDAIIPSIQVSKRIRSKLQITYYRGASNAHSTFQGICPPLVSCNGVQPLSVTSTFQNNFPFPLSEPPYYTFKQSLFFHLSILPLYWTCPYSSTSTIRKRNLRSKHQAVYTAPPRQWTLVWGGACPTQWRLDSCF